MKHQCCHVEGMWKAVEHQCCHAEGMWKAVEAMKHQPCHEEEMWKEVETLKYMLLLGTILSLYSFLPFFSCTQTN
jgi:hypothetical protein